MPGLRILNAPVMPRAISARADSQTALWTPSYRISPSGPPRQCAASAPVLPCATGVDGAEFLKRYYARRIAPAVAKILAGPGPDGAGPALARWSFGGLL